MKHQHEKLFARYKPFLCYKQPIFLVLFQVIFIWHGQIDIYIYNIFSDIIIVRAISFWIFLILLVSYSLIQHSFMKNLLYYVLISWCALRSCPSQIIHIIVVLRFKFLLILLYWLHNVTWHELSLLFSNWTISLLSCFRVSKSSFCLGII